MGTSKSSFQDLPSLLDLDTIRDMTGKRFNRELFEYYKDENGYISKERWEDLSNLTHSVILSSSNTFKFDENIIHFHQQLQSCGICVYYNKGICQTECYHRVNMSQTVILLLSEELEDISSPFIETIQYVMKTKSSSVIFPIVTSDQIVSKWNNLLRKLGMEIDLTTSSQTINLNSDITLPVSKLYDRITQSILSLALKSLSSTLSSYPSYFQSTSTSTGSAVNTPPIRIRLLSSLSIQETSNLMTNLNMKRFVTKFIENEVDGRTLNSITGVAELIELGIQVKVKARVFFDELNEFKLSGVPEFLIVSNISSDTNIIESNTRRESLDQTQTKNIAIDMNKSSTTSRGIQGYDVGIRVEGNYRGRGKWYPGKIDKINTETNSFDILYDDGEMERSVIPENVKLSQPKSNRKKSSPRLSSGSQISFNIGDRVEGNYRGRGKWYPGKIDKINTETNSFDILYDDGETERSVIPENVKLSQPKSNRKKSSPRLSSGSQVSFNIGDKVEGNYRGRGKWYPGKIDKINTETNSFDILYDDGEMECFIASENIRFTTVSIIPQPPPVIPEAMTVAIPQENTDLNTSEAMVSYNPDELEGDQTTEQEMIPEGNLPNQTRVLSNYKELGSWFLGTILSYNPLDQTYFIAYDDMDIQSAEESMIRPAFTPIERLYKEGDTIQAYNSTQNDWLMATITKVREEGTYDVMYINGDEDRCILHELVRLSKNSSMNPLSPNHINSFDDSNDPNIFNSSKNQSDLVNNLIQRLFNDGDKVLVNYKGEGQWFGGRIQGVDDSFINQNDSIPIYNVLYDDGDTETNVSENMIRLSSRLLAPGTIHYNEGDLVQGYYHGQKWENGKIEYVRDDGTYDIVYEDGEKDIRILSEMIQSRPISVDATSMEDDLVSSDSMDNVEQVQVVTKPVIVYEISDRIEGNYRNRGKWYPGKITAKSIDNCNANQEGYRYNILYDDGEEEDNIVSDCIRYEDSILPPSSPSISSSVEPSPTSKQTNKTLKYKLGDRIEANFKGRGKWYSGTITRNNRPDKTYDIAYDDKGMEISVPHECIRLINSTTMTEVVVTEVTTNNPSIVSPNQESEVVSNPIITTTNTKITTENTNISLDCKEGSKIEANYRGRGVWYPGKVSKVRSDGSYNVIYDDGESELRVITQNLRVIT